MPTALTLDYRSPRWQRNVIENLRTTFPSIQFFATTHSPFLIQSLRSGDELVMLEGQPVSSVDELPIEEIARGIQGVERPEVSARYEQMKTAARSHLEILDEAVGTEGVCIRGDVSIGGSVRIGLAAATLRLVGLDKAVSIVTDMNGKQVAIDRGSQRMQAWLTALECKEVDRDAANEPLRRATIRNAVATGFFSIWMQVFEMDTDMRQRLIDAFPGTRESGCFDTGADDAVVTPAPNPDNLAAGGKA